MCGDIESRCKRLQRRLRIPNSGASCPRVSKPPTFRPLGNHSGKCHSPFTSPHFRSITRSWSETSSTTSTVLVLLAFCASYVAFHWRTLQLGLPLVDVYNLWLPNDAMAVITLNQAQVPVNNRNRVLHRKAYHSLNSALHLVSSQCQRFARKPWVVSHRADCPFLGRHPSRTTCQHSLDNITYTSKARDTRALPWTFIQQDRAPRPTSVSSAGVLAVESSGISELGQNITSSDWRG